MIRQSDFGDDIADYVLGLLEGDARARFEDRMARDTKAIAALLVGGYKNDVRRHGS